MEQDVFFPLVSSQAKRISFEIKDCLEIVLKKSPDWIITRNKFHCSAFLVDATDTGDYYHGLEIIENKKIMVAKTAIDMIRDTTVICDKQSITNGHERTCITYMVMPEEYKPYPINEYTSDHTINGMICFDNIGTGFKIATHVVSSRDNK